MHMLNGPLLLLMTSSISWCVTVSLHCKLCWTEAGAINAPIQPAKGLDRLINACLHRFVRGDIAFWVDAPITAQLFLDSLHKKWNEKKENIKRKNQMGFRYSAEKLQCPAQGVCDLVDAANWIKERLACRHLAHWWTKWTVWLKLFPIKDRDVKLVKTHLCSLLWAIEDRHCCTPAVEPPYSCFTESRGAPRYQIHSFTQIHRMKESNVVCNRVKARRSSNLGRAPTLEHNTAWLSR